MNGAFSLLLALNGDAAMSEVLSLEATLASWLAAERALATAQAEVGDLEPDDAAAICAAAHPAAVDLGRLIADSRNVGYPILPLVRQVTEVLPSGPDGRMHYGATTQDIMDTGLVLQLSRAVERLEALTRSIGEELAVLCAEHRSTVMAARTHAQQAVPTTLGAKLAVFLSQLTRQLDRLAELRPRLLVASLHGAGGTSAALGDRVGLVRAAFAAELGLTPVGVPWHVARDGLLELTQWCTSASVLCARLAREVIDLSRTEIGEVSEAAGHHRGASSTMPQKANPVLSEAIIGLATCASALAGSMARAAEAGHERAAGEWQIEWFAVPNVLMLTSSALLSTAELVATITVSPERMAANLEADHGLLMAEAHMIALAPQLGRELAHDLVYQAVRAARADALPFERALDRQLRESGVEHTVPTFDPASYLGEATVLCDAAVEDWRSRQVSGPPPASPGSQGPRLTGPVPRSPR